MLRGDLRAAAMPSTILQLFVFSAENDSDPRPRSPVPFPSRAPVRYHRAAV